MTGNYLSSLHAGDRPGGSWAAFLEDILYPILSHQLELRRRNSQLSRVFSHIPDQFLLVMCDSVILLASVA
ncbi:MAG TPA: hypothetical protein VK203_14995 [Nostocaceae cyanobacterium]|nr:hypothetical protein [Nostocaceae cyanobacterium]